MTLNTPQGGTCHFEPGDVVSVATGNPYKDKPACVLTFAGGGTSLVSGEASDVWSRIEAARTPKPAVAGA